jgi:hypothetical protein
MNTRLLLAFAMAIALVGCSSPTAAPTTPASNGGGATPTAAAGTPGAATPTPAAATNTPAAGNTGGNGGTGTVDGTWTGTWTKPAGGGTMTLQLQQSGTNVSGKITLVGSACIPPSTALSGTVVGPNIVFTVTASTLQATFGGNFSGNTITGTMTVTCSAGSAVGTWNVTRS